MTIEPTSEVGRQVTQVKPGGRSGPASVAFGAIAAALVVAGVATHWMAPRLAGLHWLLIGPVVLLINLVGGVLATIAIVRRTRRKWGAAGLAMNVAPLLLLVGGSFFSPTPPLYTLPSGKKIRVKFAGPVYFSQDATTFVMECDTDIPIEKRAELRKEVNEIWDTFKANAEASHLTKAMIGMNHNEGTGIVTRGTRYGFGFEKQADGKWKCINED